MSSGQTAINLKYGNQLLNENNSKKRKKKRNSLNQKVLRLHNLFLVFKSW